MYVLFLEWPLRSSGSSSSSNHEELAPNVNNQDGDSGTHSMPHQEMTKDVSTTANNEPPNSKKSKTFFKWLFTFELFVYFYLAAISLYLIEMLLF